MSGRIHRKLFLSIKSSIPRLFAPPESNDASARPFNGLPFNVNVARRVRPFCPFATFEFEFPCNGKTEIVLLSRWREHREGYLKEIEGNIAPNTFPLFLVEDASPPPPSIENNPLTPPSKLDPPRVVA